MKQLRKWIFGLVIMLVICGGAASTAKAAEYSKRTSGTSLSVAHGTIKVYANATHFTTGNMRWGRQWEVYSGSSIRNSMVAGQTLIVPKNSELKTTGTFHATSNSYVSGKVSKTYTFTYSGGKVTYK